MARRAWIAVAALACAGVLATPAGAAFPGANGRLVAASASYPYLGLNTTDQLGRLQLNLVPNEGRRPAWSPDGSRVAFVDAANQIQIADLAGNRTTVLAWGNTVEEIDWSPAGDKLVAALLTCDADNYDCRPDIYTMHLDGSDLTNLTPEALAETGPAWSPDGDRIVFSSTRDEATDLYTIAPDGTGLTNLTADMPGSYFDPDWSPDGSRLVVSEQNPTRHLITMDVDGGNRVSLDIPYGVALHPAWSPDGTWIAFEVGEYGGTVITRADDTTVDSLAVILPYGREPDWQPLHIPSTRSGYPRAKHAGRMNVSLVPAYPPCGSGDPPEFQHGPPLAYPSCHVRGLSEILTVGSKATGRVRMEARRGTAGDQIDNADVEFQMNITDVSCVLIRRNCVEEQSGPWDYAGEVQTRMSVRITDRFNGAAATDASATTMEAPLVFPAPCVATADTEIGSTCSVSTSADAVLPGSVPEGKRSIWELGQVEVYDPGFYWDGQDRKPFMRQGVFVR